MNNQKDGAETAVRDHATHPEAGSGMREDRSFAKPTRDKDNEPEIAADDAGATAMAEQAQKNNDDVEQR